ISAVLTIIIVTFLISRASAPRTTTSVRNPPAGKAHIELSKTEVTSGDSYELKITGISRPQLSILYTLDEKPMGQLGVYLGTDGSATFRVSSVTRKGKYRFLAVRSSSDTDWVLF